MNAIKLPVEAWHVHDTLWTVRDSGGTRIGSIDLSEQEARQIALPLNCHDALVEALGFYARKPQECLHAWNLSSSGNFNDWISEIRQDAGDIARAALAKVEEMRKL